MMNGNSSQEHKRVFIIGPAGVGKSTCGPIFAERLGFSFIDLDSEFVRREGDVADYVRQHGYVSYGRRNTDLFFTIIEEQQRDSVFSISSGFLMYDQLDRSFSNNAKALSELGVTILLLPSASLEQSVEVVVSRVLSRRPWLDPDKETRKILDRYPRYMQYGDIKVFSIEPPGVIADIMKKEYLDFCKDRQT